VTLVDTSVWVEHLRRGNAALATLLDGGEAMCHPFVVGELARRLGATHTLDATRDDPVAAIRDLTRGGADYAFECVGNLAVIQQALEALGPGGVLTIVGVPKVGSTYEFIVHALYQNKAILGCRYGTARPRRDFPMLADLYLSGRLKIDELITRRYRLAQFDEALDELKRGQLARGVFAIS